MRRVGRRTSLIGAFTLLLAGVVGPVGRAQASTPYSGSLVTWNMSGWTAAKGSVHPADVLAANILKRAPLPTAIVVNEMCSTQYDELVKKLGPTTTAGYRSLPTWSLPNFNQTNCPKFGNAVFFRGTWAATDPSDEYTYTTQASSDPATEQRKMLCLSFSTPATSTTAATPLRVCGTHLVNNASLAALQLGQAKTIVDNDNAGGTPTLLAGDLNMTPSNTAFDGWYASYSEGDLSGRAHPRPTTTSNVKFDYGWVPKSRATVTTTAKIEMQLFVSDHAIYTTYFSLS